MRMMQRDTARTTTTRLALALGVLGVFVSVGCREALFTERDERSQYDRYDRVRGQYEPTFLYDEFGDQVPNIKGRLTPK